MSTVIVAFAQKGLHLSRKLDHRPSEYTHEYLVSFQSWYQPVEDQFAYGIAFNYIPYFPKSLSELRVSIGLYDLTSSPPKDAQETNNILIMPFSELISFDLGYSKLFPQESAHSYYELAFNADFIINYHQDGRSYLPVNPIPVDYDFFTLLMRTGIEILPLPGKISLYGNFDLLLVEPVDNNLTNNVSGLLKQAEYFDVGVKGMITPFKGKVLIEPELNVIIVEERIRKNIASRDELILSARFNISYKF
ncbi:MAG: hypothetical protein AAF843_19675 [Bacteroidota bacterium]